MKLIYNLRSLFIGILILFQLTSSAQNQDTTRSITINGNDILPLVDSLSENGELIIERLDSILSIFKYRCKKEYFVVQFSKQITPDLEILIEKERIQLLEYLGDNSYIAKMTNKRRDWFIDFLLVNQAIPYLNLMGINPREREQIEKIAFNSEQIRIIVYSFEDGKRRRFNRNLKNLSAKIINEYVSIGGLKTEIELPSKALPDLYKLSEIRKVALPSRYETYDASISGCNCVSVRNENVLNDTASTVIKANVVKGLFNLSGDGQIINVSDTGLDIGEISDDLHEDFHNQVIEIKSWPVNNRKRYRDNETYSVTYLNAGDNDGGIDFNGHGTHVAGSIVGNGTVFSKDFPNGELTGIAPNAKIVFNAFEQDTDILLKSEDGETTQIEYGDLPYTLDTIIRDTIFDSGIPFHSHSFLTYGKRKGAFIHSNSFGTTGESETYSTTAEEHDQFSWLNSSHLIISAAGNLGIDKDTNGVVDLKSIIQSAEGKNVLTIGNSYNSVTNVDSIRFKSSRGPAADGRFKPDLLVPGHWILSTRSSVSEYNSRFSPSFSSNGIDDRHTTRPTFANLRSDTAYTFQGGTSMATPIAAGSAALIREYLIKEENMSSPSSALVKALMIHGAQDMSANSTFSASIQGYPDNIQGWGRLDLEASLIVNKSKTRRVIFDKDSRYGMMTGGYYRDTIFSTGGRIVATMVYNDFPGDELINDLNLWIEDLNGNKFYPNGKDEEDRINNIEKIIIDNSRRGDYIVHVKGLIPKLKQTFALVYDYPQQGINLPPPREAEYVNYRADLFPNCKRICRKVKKDKKEICRTYKKEKRLCKGQARKAKKSCKSHHKNIKKKTIAENCNSKKGKAKRTCKKNARKNRRKGRRKCRKTKKEAKKVCKMMKEEFKECREEFREEVRECKDQCPPKQKRMRDTLHVVEPRDSGKTVRASALGKTR